jgi:GNAT superfamily N-acetyltransferase
MAGWTLAATSAAELDQIMGWFPDAVSVSIWGGPDFRFPFTAETFREDCRLDAVESFSLRNAEGQLAAFGQAYERDGRGHLARLVSNPRMRRQGAGRQLIERIIMSLEEARTSIRCSCIGIIHLRTSVTCRSVSSSGTTRKVHRCPTRVISLRDVQQGDNNEP